MTPKRKAILFIVVVVALGIAWALSAEWPEWVGDRDEGESSAAAGTAVAPEAAAPLQTPGKELTYNFDKDKPGQLPTGFHGALTGHGKPGNWTVQADTAAPSKPNVLAQTSADKTDYRFPLAVADDGSFADMDLAVKFKAVSGKVDQAGGVIFHLQDANNYYVVRANALENNFNLYKVVAGRRREITGTNVTVPSGQWHELRVEVRGNRITCYFNGAKKIDTTDNTFANPGKIGLWTKADSVTSFDDLTVTAR